MKLFAYMNVTFSIIKENKGAEKSSKTKKMIKDKRNGYQNNIVSTRLFDVDVVKNEMKILNSKSNSKRCRDPKLKKQQRNKTQTKTH